MAEPLNATFNAYRKRERSGVLLGAGLGFAIVMIVMIAVFAGIAFAVGGSVFTWYGQVMQATAAGDQAQIANLPPPSGIFIFIPLYFLFLFCLFVALAAFEAACLRWMIRGEVSGFFGLNLGADTWRVYGTYWVWFGLFIAFYIGFAIFSFMLGGAAAVADQSGNMMMATVFLLPLTFCLALIIFGVRLAPAAATSVGRGEFSFFKAWTVTSGRFWSLLGALLLLGIIYVVASIVIGIGGFGLILGAAAPAIDWASAAHDPQAFSAAYTEAIMKVFSTPLSIGLYIALQVVSWAVALFFYVGFYGINARAVEAALAEGKIERAGA